MAYTRVMDAADYINQLLYQPRSTSYQAHNTNSFGGALANFLQARADYENRKERKEFKKQDNAEHKFSNKNEGTPTDADGSYSIRSLFDNPNMKVGEPVVSVGDIPSSDTIKQAVDMASAPSLINVGAGFQQAQAMPQQGIAPIPKSAFQQRLDALPSAKYLGDQYGREQWLADDEASGVTNRHIRQMRYNQMVEPMIQQAKKDRLRLALDTYLHSTDPAEQREALAVMALEEGKPTMLQDKEYEDWKRGREKETYNHEKSLWDIKDQAERIKLVAAEQALDDKKNSKQLQLNAQKIGLLFGDGRVYEMPLNETMEDTGLQKTDKEVVSGLNLLNTYSRKFFNTDLSANGGWRSEGHQRKLYEEQGKEPFMGSLHLKGRAVDIDVSKLSDAQREELIGFAEKLGFNTTYHDIGNGIHLHVELGQGRHLTDANVLMGNAGLKPSKENKNTKQTGSKYDSQTLADMVNSTYPEGKTRATDAERGEVGNYMAGIVPLVASPQDNWAQTAEKVYNYYQNTVGAGKGWTLNSEEFSNLVGRAVHKYFLDATGVDIPVNTISGYVFAKFDPESQKRMADAKKAAEENKDKPKTIEEEAEQVLGKNSKTKVNKEKSEEQKPMVGSKLANDLNQPITFNGIMEGIRANPSQYTDPNLTWHW